MLYVIVEKRLKEPGTGMGMWSSEQDTLRLINALQINWGKGVVGKMATKWGRGPSQNTVGAHYELSGLCNVDGRMKIVEGGIRATREGEEALNMGFLVVYNKCSLNNCGIEWRKRYRESSWWLGLEGRRIEGGVFLVYSSA